MGYPIDEYAKDIYYEGKGQVHLVLCSTIHCIRVIDNILILE